MRRVYLDYNATAPLMAEALEAAVPYYTSVWGNASSIHRQGREARTAVDQLATTRVQDWARAFVPSGDQYLTTAIQKIVLQNENPATAFSAAAAEITASYEQNVARYL
jgi:hypothetical protein